MEEKKTSKKMLLWGIGTAGEGFISSISGTYLAIFLTDVALVPVALSGGIMLVTSIIGFVMATITGGIIASIKPMPWGRLRSWLLVAPPVAVLFFMLHFTAIPGNVFMTTVLVILGYAVAVSAWNFAYAADVSLTNILGNTQEERNKFNSQRMMGSNIGRLMGNYLTPILVAFLSGTGMSEAMSYPVLVFIAGMFFMAAELIQFALSKGKEEEYHKENNTDDQTLKLKDIVETLKTNSQLLVTLCIDLTSNMAGIALPSLAVYYYKYVFEAPAFVSTHMLCIGLSGLCGSTMVRLFGRKVKSYKKFLMTVYLCMSACLFCTRFTRTPLAFLCVNLCVHIMTGTTQPFEMNLYQDNVIYSEYLTGVNANSLIMGLCEFPVKIAGILKSVLLTAVLISSGFVAGATPTPELKSALANAYSLIPAAIPIMGFLLLKFAYKLTPEKMEEAKKAIEARATQDHL